MNKQGKTEVGSPEETKEITENPDVEWATHCRTAAQAFLKNVVVIDNEPFVGHYTPQSVPRASAVSTGSPFALNVPLTGMGAAISPSSNTGNSGTSHHVAKQVPDMASSDEPGGPPSTVNTLDIRAVGDAFAEAGLACAFVLPDDYAPDQDAIIERVMKGASVADVTILDWYLKGESPNLTLNILEKIAASDVSNSGRLRMICVYTGQSDLDGVFTDSKAALHRGGVVLKDISHAPLMAKSDHCLLLVLNKTRTPHIMLPEHIISGFGRLGDGLVPAFALASVGAIRNSTHHMLTRFESELDTAYVANRLITDPPEDVMELMRDLLISECDSALGFESVAETYLDVSAIKKWLALRPQGAGTAPAAPPVDMSAAFAAIDKLNREIKGNRKATGDRLGVNMETIQAVERILSDVLEKSKGKQAKVKRIRKSADVDLSLISELLEYGINERGINPRPGEEPSVEIEERNRPLISHFLAGNGGVSRAIEAKFSRFVGLRREAFSSHKTPWDANWRPALTTGSILKARTADTDIAEYLICLTPACDALRLDGERIFSFIRAHVSSGPHNLVIKNEDGTDLYLKFNTKLPEIRAVTFSPDSKRRRVVAANVKRNEKDAFIFMDCEKKEYLWLGELRYNRIISEIGKITGTWMRVGVVDSEYLRIMAK